jgi:LAO/AO transport system kinase
MPTDDIDIVELLEQIRDGDRFALGKGITLVESQLPKHREVAIELLELSSKSKSNSIRIAITGSPGVGKSTFIESFGLYLVGLGKRVAILAIDPSSQLSKGSILGDKTRMPKLSTHQNAFIRPSPSGTTLGGVAQRTRESIQLCEAAGYNIILIETVGVGQSEYQVSNMVDFFMLLLLPGAGDGLQGIKRGIVEMADLIVVNKADGDRIGMAQQTKSQFQNALHFYPTKETGWSAKIVLTSALEENGMDRCWEEVESFISKAGPSKIEDKRNIQKQTWLNDRLSDWINDYLIQNDQIQDTLKDVRKQLKNESITVSKAIHLIQEKIKTIIHGGT